MYTWPGKDTDSPYTKGDKITYTVRTKMPAPCGKTLRGTHTGPLSDIQGVYKAAHRALDQVIRIHLDSCKKMSSRYQKTVKEQNDQCRKTTGKTRIHY